MREFRSILHTNEAYVNNRRNARPSAPFLQFRALRRHCCTDWAGRIARSRPPYWGGAPAVGHPAADRLRQINWQDHLSLRWQPWSPDSYRCVRRRHRVFRPRISTRPGPVTRVHLLDSTTMSQPWTFAGVGAGHPYLSMKCSQCSSVVRSSSPLSGKGSARKVRRHVHRNGEAVEVVFGGIQVRQMAPRVGRNCGQPYRSP